MVDDPFVTDQNGRKFRKYDHIETKPLLRFDYKSREIDSIIQSQVATFYIIIYVTK